jgi:hypothetical protein
MTTRTEADEESRRLARLLHTLLRTANRSVRSVEQQMGVGGSGLGKVLNGTIRLQIGHIFLVLEALDMTPGQFFHLAYPGRQPAHAVSDQFLRERGMGPADAEIDAPEMETLVRRTVLRMMKEFLGREAAAAAMATITTAEESAGSDLVQAAGGSARSSGPERR